MEHHALDPIIVLKLEITCCKECPEKLKKALWKIKGVRQVAFDSEKNLVCIRGDINPLKLFKAITKRIKNAELMFYDKKPMNEDNSGENLHMKGLSEDKNPNDHCHNFYNADGNDEDKDEVEDDYYDFHFEMEDSVHNHKYRAAAEEAEEETSWDRYDQFCNTCKGYDPTSRDSDYMNHHLHQHKDPSRENIHVFIEQAEEDLRRIHCCREYLRSRKYWKGTK